MEVIFILYALFSSILISIKSEECGKESSDISYKLLSNPIDYKIELCTHAKYCISGNRTNYIKQGRTYYSCIINQNVQRKLKFQIGKVKRSLNINKLNSSYRCLSIYGTFEDSCGYYNKMKIPNIKLGQYEILIIRCGENYEKTFRFRELPYLNNQRLKYIDERMNEYENRKFKFHLVPIYRYICLSQCGEEVQLSSDYPLRSVIKTVKSGKLKYSYFYFKKTVLSVVVKMTCKNKNDHITLYMKPIYTIGAKIVDLSTIKHKRNSYKDFDFNDKLKCLPYNKVKKTTNIAVHFPNAFIKVFNQGYEYTMKNQYTYQISRDFKKVKIKCHYGAVGGWYNTDIYYFGEQTVYIKARTSPNNIRINGKSVIINNYRFIAEQTKKISCHNSFLILFTALGYYLPRGDFTKYPSYQFIHVVGKNSEMKLKEFSNYSTYRKKLYAICFKSSTYSYTSVWNSDFVKPNKLKNKLIQPGNKYSIPVEIRIVKDYRIKQTTVKWKNVFPPWKQKAYFAGNVIACYDLTLTNQPVIDLDGVATYITPDIDNEVIETTLTWQATRYIKFKEFYSDQTFNLSCYAGDENVEILPFEGNLLSFYAETVSQNEYIFIAGKDYLICYANFGLVKGYKQNIKSPLITKLIMNGKETISKNKRGILIPKRNSKTNYQYCCPRDVKFDYKMLNPNFKYICRHNISITVVKQLKTDIEPNIDIKSDTIVYCYICLEKYSYTCTYNRHLRIPTKIKLYIKDPSGKENTSDWNSSITVPKAGPKPGGGTYEIDNYNFKFGCQAGSDAKIEWHPIKIGSCEGSMKNIELYPKIQNLFYVGNRVTCGTKNVMCVKSFNRIRLYRKNTILEESYNGIKFNSNHTGDHLRVACVISGSEVEGDDRYVRVEGKPADVQILPRVAYAVYGNYFTCNTNGFPKPDIYWVQEDNKTWFRIVENFLIIRPYDISGVYTIKCVSSNKHGVKEDSLTFEFFNPLISINKYKHESDYHTLLLLIFLFIYLVIMAFVMLIIIQEHYLGEPILFKPPVTIVSVATKQPNLFNKKEPLSKLSKIVKETDPSETATTRSMETGTIT